MLIHAFSLLLLAFAVSLDGFGVGVTYGLRRIRIPVLSVAIIAFCSGLVVWLAMAIGSVLTGYMSPFTAKLIGAILLMLIGSYALFQWWKRRQADEDDGNADEARGTEQATASGTEGILGAGNAQATGGTADEGQIAGAVGNPNGNSIDDSIGVPSGEPGTSAIINLELKRLGIVIQILRTPQIADVDRSGTISSSEAVLLGFALSLDSFGAGLGAAMVGFNPLLTAVVIASVSGLFLLAGMRLGFRFAAWEGMKAMSVLPGILLIVMGFIRLM